MFLSLRSSLVLLFCAAALALGIAGQAESVAELAARCSPAVVQVIMFDAAENKLSTGSGFVVAPGLVATCYHVIDGGVSAQVKTVDKVSYPVNAVVAYNRERDLAILRVKHLKDIPPLALGDLALTKPGELAVALGSPLGLEGSAVTDGVVSAIRTRPSQGEVVQVSCPASPGNSGGPVLNGKGEVIGVIASSRIDGQNVNFGISVASLNELLRNPLPKEIDLAAFYQQQHKEDIATYGILPACPATIRLEVPKNSPHTLAPFLLIKYLPESVRISVLPAKSNMFAVKKEKESIKALQLVTSEQSLVSGAFFLAPTGALKFHKDQRGAQILLEFSYQPRRVAIVVSGDAYHGAGGEVLEDILQRIGFETVRGAEVDAAVAASHGDLRKLAKTLDCALMMYAVFRTTKEQTGKGIFIEDRTSIELVDLNRMETLIDGKTGESATIGYLRSDKQFVKGARKEGVYRILGDAYVTVVKAP